MNVMSFLNLKKTYYMTNKKINELVDLGISLTTLKTLKESEINTLHKNLIENKKKTNEQVTSTNKSITVTKIPQNIAKTTGANVSNVDIKQDSSGNIVATQLNQGKEDSKKSKIISDTEMKEGDTKKSGKLNPWAICHAQVGPKKTPKFERCVKQVKKSIAEGKNPFSVILENKIVSLLEKHIQPKMKKGELLDLIGKKKMKTPIGKLSSIGMMEDDTKTAPTKPVTKPGTKTPPKEKPFDPFKPNPSHRPNPKAKKKIETNEADAPTIAPTKPVTKPTTKPTTKPEPFDPFKPKPGYNPNPKAKKSTKLPEWLSFKNLGLNLK